MQTSLEVKWADGIYRFRLPIPQITEIQRKTGLGIGALYAKLVKNRYQIPNPETGEMVAFGDPATADYALQDVLEPIRQGLIGGNWCKVDGEEKTVSPDRVQELLDIYCYPERPLNEASDLAFAIISACILGWDEPERKKKEDEPKPTPPGKRRKKKAGSTTREPLPISPSPDATSSQPAT